MYLSVCLFVSVLLVLLILSRQRRWKLARIGLNPGVLGLRLHSAKREFAANGHRLVGKAYREV